MANKNGAPTRERRSLLTGAFLLVLIIFFLLSSLFVYSLIAGVNRAERSVVQPITDLVRQLIIPVTPAILPSSTTIVNQINDLARLETASVDLEKVITAERNSDVLWGALGETMVFVAHGRVVAGVDFAQMTADDLQVVDPNTVWIHLPDAVIFGDLPVLDNERSYVADRDTGLLTRADPELETQVRRAAEVTIREEALNSGVLETADINARQYMLDFLTSLGFENVEFYEDTPPMAPMYEQPIPKGFAVTPAAP